MRSYGHIANPTLVVPKTVQSGLCLHSVDTEFWEKGHTVRGSWGARTVFNHAMCRLDLSSNCRLCGRRGKAQMMGKEDKLLRQRKERAQGTNTSSANGPAFSRKFGLTTWGESWSI